MTQPVRSGLPGHGGRDQPPAGGALDLVFTLWYLRAKRYVQAGNNSDFSLTAAGVDYLESVSNHNQMARELMRPQGASAGPAYPREYRQVSQGLAA